LPTETFTDPVIADDIDKILSELSAKLTYASGYDDGQKELIMAVCKTMEEAIGRSVKDLLSEMIAPSEDFYNRLLAIVPKDKIIQHRIGLDYTTKTPATLTVISHECEDKLEEIMDMAAELDLKLFRESGKPRFFWVITDHKLDQRLIDHDFPFYYPGDE